MCGCRSSTVERDSTPHYGDSRLYHCKRRHQNCSDSDHCYVSDADTGGETSNNVDGNCNNDSRDSCSDKGSCDSFIGDDGGSHHDSDPVCRFYDVDHFRRDCGYFRAYRSDGGIGSYFVVRHVEGGTYFEI